MEMYTVYNKKQGEFLMFGKGRTPVATLKGIRNRMKVKLTDRDGKFIPSASPFDYKMTQLQLDETTGEIEIISSGKYNCLSPTAFKQWKQELDERAGVAHAST